MPICKITGQQFEITDKDREFYKMMGVPEPTICPEMRIRHRMVFRNESSLYHRKCDKTGKQMISVHHPDVKFPVYKGDEWYSDSWDAKDYGRNYDFNRPFFEQFLELKNTVPHLGLVFLDNENCDYCNVVGNCKNCYLIFGSIECEDCYYGNPFHCTNCIDSLVLRDSELCIECIDSIKLYDCYKCQDCSNSTNLKFCIDVHNSKNCFACVGLNQKEYCILNKQYTKEQYEDFMKRTDLTNPEVYNRIVRQLEELRLQKPQRAYIGTNNENVSGNYIFNSKNCNWAFNVSDCEDVSYSFQLMKMHNSQDISNGEYANHCYEISALYSRVSNARYCYYLWDNVDSVTYMGDCTQNVKDCFGCQGLKQAQYCILNKQYTKQEYEEMVPRIIEHMKSTGEWGQFFPGWVSAYGYNETVAQEYYPLEREEAIKLGYNWLDDPQEGKYIGPKIEIPSDPNTVDQSFCSQVLICEVTGKPYKILPQELKAYQRMGVPLPKRCPKQRHLDRLSKRNPMRLYDRTCAKTGAPIKTTYAPDRPEIIYSEEAYRQEIF